jgi:hypothetical protein
MGRRNAMDDRDRSAVGAATEMGVERLRARNWLLLGTAAAAGAAGLSLWLTRGAAREEAAVSYSPIDQPKLLAEDVWIVDSGPISAMGLKLPVRMTVVRLKDGSLLLHSPTAYTADLGRALDALGPVRHLIAPTIAHWMFLGDWQRAYPGATSWGVPALRERAQVRSAGLRIDADLGDQAPEAWAGDLQQGLVRGGGGFEEAWFLHKPSRTLLLADLIENVEPSKLPPATAAAMRATMATCATTALHVRAALALGGGAARDAIKAMLATEPARVIVAHGKPLTQDAAGQLRRAFAWAV